MYRTYELYVRDDEGHGRFQVVSCKDEEIMAHVDRLLAQPQAKEVDVRQAGEVMFTVAK